MISVLKIRKSHDLKIFFQSSDLNDFARISHVVRLLFPPSDIRLNVFYPIKYGILAAKENFRCT